MAQKQNRIMAIPPQMGYPPQFSQYGVPGYASYDCQQTPYTIPAVFDEGKKRGIDEVISPSQLNQNGFMDKRIRNQSPTTVFDLDSRTIQTQRPDDSAILQAINSLRTEVSTNVKADDLRNLATKEDIHQINLKLEGYAKEVTDLKMSFEKHKADLRDISELSNKNAASIMDLGQRISGPEEGGALSQRGQYGGVPSRPIQNNQMQKRMNLVLEGISMDKDPYGYLLELGEDLGFVVYKRDITNVTRLRRRDSSDPKPPPLLVSFNQSHVRDSYLRNKYKLKGNPKYDQIWINADETMEVRRLKSRFRRIAYLARRNGETVYFNHQSITIGENTFNASQLSLIPDAYKPDSEDTQPKRVPEPERAKADNPVRVEDGEQDMDTNPSTKFQFVKPTVEQQGQKEGKKRKEPANTAKDRPKDAGACRYPNRELPKDLSQGGLIKMRLTPHGLCFSGPTAFVSNMHKVTFYDDDGAKCVSVEQRYSFLEAMFNKEFDLALALTNPDLTGYQVKDMCKNLPNNPAWNALKFPTLKRLMIKKFEQNPALLQDLIDTAPYRLIEASWDMLWGGGQPYESTDYDDGTFIGGNKFGDMATEWRDEVIAGLKAKK